MKKLYAYLKNLIMPRKNFFTEFHIQVTSINCVEQRHSDCDGYVPREEFTGHDKPCSCHCHLTMAERMRLKSRKETHPRYK